MTASATPTVPQPVYLFIDEGGNLDFNPSGSRFFTLTSVVIPRPFPFESPFTELKFDLLSTADIEYFHATEDRQAVRDQVFAIIGQYLPLLHIDTLLVEKSKTPPSLRSDARFYPHTLGDLLRHVVEQLDPAAVSTLMVVTDRIPINKRRQSIEKAVKETLAAALPPAVSYRVVHHDSKSCAGLQVADYINWAIFRNAERGDSRSFNLIKSAIRSQRNMFG